MRKNKKKLIEMPFSGGEIDRLFKGKIITKKQNGAVFHCRLEKPTKRAGR